MQTVGTPSGLSRERSLGIAAPTAPHDDLSFEELARKYNFSVTSDRRGLLVRLLLKEFARVRGPVRALDIGCGPGISDEPGVNVEYLRVVREHVDELWGVEPDEGIRPEHGLLTNFQHAFLETAELPEAYFDVAYSYFVMEHVTDPEAFLRALSRCLKPGGVYIFVTPNGGHYFVKIARFLKSLRLDELVLRAVRGAKVEEYHYPVVYAFNRPGQIRRAAAATGFDRVGFAFVERSGPRQYFPGPMLPIYHALQWKRRVWKKPESLLELMCRMQKAT